MKTCTKLHFKKYDENGNEINGVIKTDFFIGGALLCERNDSNVVVGIQRIKAPTSDLLIEEPSSKIDFEYKLIPEDYVFVDTTNLITIDGKTYVKILPVYDVFSLKQNLECRCSIVKGELPYNVNHGIPLKAQLIDTQLSILNIINTTPGVQSCEVLGSKLVDKKFRLDIKVNSNFGTFVVSAG